MIHRGKGQKPAHTANASTVPVICTFVSTAFPAWLLVPAPVPSPGGIGTV